MTTSVACRRVVAHTPHGTCPGTAPEYPSEKVQLVCTGCERNASELVPWSGEQLCWDCVDTQLDLMAKAVSEEMDVALLTRLADIDCAWLEGDITGREHNEMVLVAIAGA